MVSAVRRPSSECMVVIRERRPDGMRCTSCIVLLSLIACAAPPPDRPDDLARLRTADSRRARQFVAYLASTDDARIEAAIEFVLEHRTTIRSLLWKLSVARDRTLAFRARQLIDMFDGIPDSGLRLGIFVREPHAPVGQPIPGWDVFMNVSERPILVEMSVAPHVRTNAPCQGGWFV